MGRVVWEVCEHATKPSIARSAVPFGECDLPNRVLTPQVSLCLCVHESTETEVSPGQDWLFRAALYHTTRSIWYLKELDISRCFIQNTHCVVTTELLATWGAGVGTSGWKS